LANISSSARITLKLKSPYRVTGKGCRKTASRS
jgi:hypothetical protein